MSFLRFTTNDFCVPSQYLRFISLIFRRRSGFTVLFFAGFFLFFREQIDGEINFSYVKHSRFNEKSFFTIRQVARLKSTGEAN